MPPLQNPLPGGAILIGGAAPSASLDRSKEWEHCCVNAMGFEWVDRFEEQHEDEPPPIQGIINLLDDDAFADDDDFVVDDENHHEQHRRAGASDAWLENALRIQADLNRMADWIQSKQQEYVGLDMKDDEASLIQSTVTTFAATTASELETLREMIAGSGASAASSDLANHRSGIVQILLERLQRHVTTPFGILQKQRTRVAVQLWQNPLQCKLYQPSLRKGRRSRSNPPGVAGILFDDDDDNPPHRNEQRFLPRHAYPTTEHENGCTSFIAKYAQKPSTRIPPEPPAFLTRLAKRRKQSHAFPASPAGNDPADGSSSSVPSFQATQNKTWIPTPSPMDYQRQLEQDLHEETALLATQMVASNELDGVRQMETRMVEITTLIGQFSNLVQDQQEQVLQVQTSARETKQNMERGREHLVDATERTRQSRHYKAWLIFGMTLILLFFHTLRN